MGAAVAQRLKVVVVAVAVAVALPQQPPVAGVMMTLAATRGHQQKKPQVKKTRALMGVVASPPHSLNLSPKIRVF